MPANKNALIGYKTIGRCLRNRYRRWTLDDLVDACYDALYDMEGIRKGVCARTVQMNIQIILHDCRVIDNQHQRWRKCVCDNPDLLRRIQYRRQQHRHCRPRLLRLCFRLQEQGFCHHAHPFFQAKRNLRKVCPEVGRTDVTKSLVCWYNYHKKGIITTRKEPSCISLSSYSLYSPPVLFPRPSLRCRCAWQSRGCIPA